MSTAFSKRMQSTATRLLTKYGSSVTLIRAGSRVWDAASGEYIQEADTQVQLIAVPVPAAGDLAGTRPVHFIDGTTIEAGDMKLICDYSVSVKMADKILFKGDLWSVLAVSPPQVNDDIIVYFVLIRK